MNLPAKVLINLLAISSVTAFPQYTVPFQQSLHLYWVGILGLGQLYWVVQLQCSVGYPTTIPTITRLTLLGDTVLDEFLPRRMKIHALKITSWPRSKVILNHCS